MALDAGALRRLAAELQAKLKDLETIAEEGTRERAALPPGSTPARTTLRVLGSILHDFYTATEDIFELIAVDLNCRVPWGWDWQKRLLHNMMQEIPGLRPAVISHETGAKLEDYLGFRQAFRNVYGHRLEWRRMAPLVEELPEVHQRLEADIERFRAYLLDLAEKLERAPAAG